MNKKISTAFAIAVIILIAGVFTLIFTKSDQDFGPGTYVQSKAGDKKVEKTDCSKRAYDGEVKIKGWYVKDGESWVLQISDSDLEKLPESYRGSRIILADASESIIAKLKKSSEKNPSEITIKGFYFRCDGIPMASISPGEEIFKKYLTQK